MRASPGRVGRGTPDAGVEDRDHVGRPEPPEGDGPLQGGDDRLAAVDGLQLDELVQVPGQSRSSLGLPLP